ncbi:solute carrier family 2, facilitated glucose transporter member 8-like isoform X1 [Montipora foliosa]|uniref:solute carrier family 2, facilitated glucose transporter member 8-like isoform X1 n=2 Tax=Montipora foliosa TaxID=591990 RepID=UPI0035F1BCFC
MKPEGCLDHPTELEPPKRKHRERLWSVLIACLSASFASFSFGYGMGYSSAAVTQLSDKDTKDLYLDKDEITWFGSLLNIGAMIGGILGGYVIDLVGRKCALMLTAVPFTAGWLMIGLGNSAALLNAGRFFSGLGVGMGSLIAPNYISETAPSRLRGSFGAFNQIGIVSGILLSFVSGHYLDWRWSAIVGISPPACLFLCMIFMPETARWLLAHNKEKRAEKTLKWLRGRDSNIQEEIEEIKESLISAEGKKQRMTFKDFTKPSLLRPFLISMTLHLFQQTTGVNAVMFYCATIFETAGFAENSTMVSILIGVIQFFAACVALTMIDRGGRRFLLIAGGAGMSASCFIMGAYFYVTLNPEHSSGIPDISWVAVTSVAVYIVGFAMSWGPCTWLLMSELFPVKARGTFSGIATAFNWLCSFAVTKSFSAQLEVFTPAGTFWFFGGLAFCACVFVAVFVPETKGKSLEEIQLYFEKKDRKESSSEPVRESNV